MSTAYHSKKSQFRWIWTNDAARTTETDVTAEDVTNQCLGIQDDTGVMYRATDDDPVAFEPITSGGTGSSGEHITEQASANTILPPVAIRRRTSGTPAAGIGASIEFTTESDVTEDAAAGEIAFAFSEVTEPDQVSAFIVFGYYGSTQIPLAIIKAADITPVTINDLMASMGTGAVLIRPYTEADTEVPTGNYAAIVGGIQTKADGNASFAAGGQENNAAADRSLVIGYGSQTSMVSGLGMADGYFGAVGDAQFQIFPIRCQTPDDTPLTIFQGLIYIATNTSFTFEVTINARNIDNPPENAFLKYYGRGHTGAALSTIVLDASANLIDSQDDGAWQLGFDVESASNALRIDCVGDVADTVNWMGYVKLITVGQA